MWRLHHLFLIRVLLYLSGSTSSFVKLHSIMRVYSYMMVHEKESALMIEYGMRSDMNVTSSYSPTKLIDGMITFITKKTSRHIWILVVMRDNGAQQYAHPVLNCVRDYRAGLVGIFYGESIRYDHTVEHVTMYHDTRCNYNELSKCTTLSMLYNTP